MFPQLLFFSSSIVHSCVKVSEFAFKYAEIMLLDAHAHTRPSKFSTLQKTVYCY